MKRERDASGLTREQRRVRRRREYREAAERESDFWGDVTEPLSFVILGTGTALGVESVIDQATHQMLPGLSAGVTYGLAWLTWNECLRLKSRV